MWCSVCRRADHWPDGVCFSSKVLRSKLLILFETLANLRGIFTMTEWGSTP